MRDRAIGAVQYRGDRAAAPARPDIETIRRRTTQAMVAIAALLILLVGYGLFRLVALVLATVMSWFGPLHLSAATVNSFLAFV